MHADKELNRFAADLIRLVRARAIQVSTLRAQGKVGDQNQRPLPKECVDEVVLAIPEVVDTVLFELLDAADNGWSLAWRREDGSYVTLEELGLGEMAGWYIGEDGWRDWFSKEDQTDS